MKKEESARTENGNARNHTHAHYITLPNPYQLSDSMILAQLEEMRDWLRAAVERIGYEVEVSAKTNGYAVVAVNNFKRDEDGEICDFAYLTATRYQDGHVRHDVSKRINNEHSWKNEIAPDMGFTFEVIDV